ncbi:PorP/SprF family type IX secretion system membrane protein [Membranihabitans maritimus]|uniref:PorP/SprF family type IX secretion system membrane protein n=1 Tax=Membranihabitans maritimus TaxID=2904244 RepID=UPI001F1E3FE8|nr:PorP/SprF family type IX secretion system membrane protein [Membranihabitans maritimus]
MKRNLPYKNDFDTLSANVGLCVLLLGSPRQHVKSGNWIRRRVAFLISAILVLTLGVSSISAQEIASYKHYTLNQQLINPAASGMNGHKIMLNYVNRWNAFPGNPQTFTGAYNGPVGERIGLGAMLISDNLGSLNRTTGQLSYAYRLDIEDTKLSIGLSTGYERYKLQASALLGTGIDPNDPIIADAAEGYDVFDAAVGVHAELPDGFTAGLALPNLIRTRVDNNSDNESTESSLFKYFVLYAGYKAPLEEYNFEFEPSIQVRNVRNAPFQVDLNLLGYYADDQLIGGFTYTIGGGNGANILLGTRINKINILYSYGVSFADFQTYNNGSHEISLIFDLFNPDETEDDQDDRRKRRR